MAYDSFRISRDSYTLALTAPNAYLVDDVFIETVYCEFGNQYILGYTYDGSEYQVVLIQPEEYVGQHNVSRCHLWSDGKLCLSQLPNTGWRSIEGARARGILWCTAYSLFLHTDEFAFNP